MRVISLLLCLLILVSCEEKSKYPVDKRYWTPEDYHSVLLNSLYKNNEEDKTPSFNDPETRIVVEKLMDHSNYLIVLDDNELGLKYRSEVAQKFFDEWKDLYKLYNVTDRKDQYKYEKEFLSAVDFGLGLQIKYFKLGNDNIIKNSSNPKESRIQNILKDNEQIVVVNFENQLELINEESVFSKEGLDKLNSIYDEHFVNLHNTFPSARYSSLVTKMELLKEKCTSEKIRKTLDELITKMKGDNS
ncbi:hypothetical protein [Spongiivirga citrea]|uniref:Lipoprotein n=1 Tax=Spongiivirga citrea TaxID=1481457 RepID=A0A6M0CKF4_9FLAO|nr:hypothetical protein [Spongiivirga citrea]NER18408.1 hypothetical protein [Spongiivirga citrea]